MTVQSDIGLIGLAVMGENLALNVESRGFRISVFNRTTAKTDELLGGRAKGKNFFGAKTLSEFIGSLKKPRRVFLMVKAGKPVDDMIAQVLPLLERGDIIIDGGNSLYTDTERRCTELEAKGFHYLGTGVSGGEEGALRGPSIMAGGSREAYDAVAPILRKIAAQVDGEPCCAYIGAGGAGHFVKMVHNGIEYGDMQLICEAYQILRYGLGLTVPELQKVFEDWNKGDLDSYLIEITAKILAVKDPVTGAPMIDMIQDQAGQKGTGGWTIKAALDFGIPISTISEAVFARSISAMKEERVAASEKLKMRKIDTEDEWSWNDPRERLDWLPIVRDSLYASKICSYAQGYALLRAASLEKKWNLDFGEIAKIWRGGCIIRARFLHRIKEAYDRKPQLANLMLDPYFSDIVTKAQYGWRTILQRAISIGLPMPAISASLAYYDSYRTARLSANLLQAQRDYFGAHTYERMDQPKGKFFHLDWCGDQKQREA